MCSPNKFCKMSLKDIFKEICDKLEDVNETLKKFSEIDNDESRFKYADNVFRPFLTNLNFKRVNKCAENSGKVRKLGNESFAKNDPWEALKLYNESIALAPFESEEFAFAYGNRAACLLRLNFPKEALGDVQKALNVSVDNDFRNKLLLRKEKCLNSLKNNNNKSNCIMGCGDLVSLSGSKSSFFDSTSDVVKLSYDNSLGRLLAVEENIKTGDVLIVEKPYSSILLINSLYTHCMTCYKRSINLIPCSRCCRAMFCSEDCLTISRNNCHAVECHILDVLVRLTAEKLTLLSFRILIYASQQGKELEKLYKETKLQNNNNVYESHDFINIYNLVTNSKKRSPSDLLYKSFVAVILIHLLDKYSSFFSSVEDGMKNMLKVFSGGLILRFMQNMPCNAHEISEFCGDELNEIGAGAYATLSLINHSCDPNVVRHCFGDVIVLRAIRPIKKGEEILDNYGYHYATHTLTERRKALMSQYYFQCECEACTQCWPTYEHLPAKNVTLKKGSDMKVYETLTAKFEENLQKIFKGNFNSEIIEENLEYLDFLDEAVVRPWQNYNACQEALKHCWSFTSNHFTLSKPGS